MPQGGQGEQGILLFGYSEHVECPGADRAHSATYVDFTGSALGQTGHIVQLTWSTQGVPRGGQGTNCNLHGVHREPRGGQGTKWNLHGLHHECPGANRACIHVVYLIWEYTVSVIGQIGHLSQFISIVCTSSSPGGQGYLLKHIY